MRTVRILIRVFFASLYLSIKNLTTPKGFMTFLALLVSIAAYVRSSIQVTDVYFILDSPITAEIVAQEQEDGTFGLVRHGFMPFDLLISSDGPQSLYVDNIQINIVPRLPDAQFDEYCIYWQPEKNGSRSGDSPHNVTLQPISKTYDFDIGSGFVIQGNATIPFQGALTNPAQSTPEEIAAISTAFGATFIGSMDARVDEIISPDATEFDVCLTGSVIVSGSAPERFRWSTEQDNTFSVGRGNEQSARIPTAPGGQFVGETRRQSVSVYSPLFRGQAPVIRKWTINLL